jgi:hypothetical protein
VDHIGADGMSPCHIAPWPAEWIVLIEHMVFAVIINHPVRVVIPAAFRSEVELRPQLLFIEVLLTRKGIGLENRIKTLGALRVVFVDINCSFFAFKLADFKINPVIRFIMGKPDTKFAYLFTVYFDTNQTFPRFSFNGEV